LEGSEEGALLGSRVGSEEGLSEGESVGVKEGRWLMDGGREGANVMEGFALLVGAEDLTGLVVGGFEVMLEKMVIWEAPAGMELGVMLAKQEYWLLKRL